MRMKIGYEWGYLYCTICPYYGDVFCMLLPEMTKECFEIFIREFEAYVNSKAVLVLNRATNHQYVKGSSIALKHLPAAGSELNPVERFFKELRKPLANKVFENIGELEEYLIKILLDYRNRPTDICKLTMFPYIKDLYTTS